jgi:hypothetical protein
MRGPQERTARSMHDNRGRLAEELAALPGKTTRELMEAWQELIGTPPPARLSRDLLIRVIAYTLQEAALGGLPPSAKRKLAALTRSAEKGGDNTADPMLRLKPGAKLARVWRGKTHTVLVLQDGYEHRGKRYNSLTQIAHEVTGAHWSGPRFFGLAVSQRTTARSEPRNGS